jgi:RNA polymerase sigma-70 factor (ECF subfamily)
MPEVDASKATVEEFRAFFDAFERPLWQAVAAGYGPDAADDAVADAWTYAWSRWDHIAGLDNPRGYLYVAAVRSARHARQRHRRGQRLPAPDPTRATSEPQLSFPAELADALNRLTTNQRTAVFLTAAGGMHLAEVAELLGVSVSTVRNHIARGLSHLRADLREDLDARS